jgi:hypothetical protein
VGELAIDQVSREFTYFRRPRSAGPALLNLRIGRIPLVCVLLADERGEGVGILDSGGANRQAHGTSRMPTAPDRRVAYGRSVPVSSPVRRASIRRRIARDEHGRTQGRVTGHPCLIPPPPQRRWRGRCPDTHSRMPPSRSRIGRSQPPALARLRSPRPGRGGARAERRGRVPHTPAALPLRLSLGRGRRGPAVQNQAPSHVAQVIRSFEALYENHHSGPWSFANASPSRSSITCASSR